MFETIGYLFNILLYQPLFNLLILLQNFIPGHDFGIAIIITTVLIKLVIYPLSVKAVKSQKALQNLQPKLKEAQEKYKDDKERQAKEVLAIYKTEKINPFSGLLIAFVQLPILIALYRVFWKGLSQQEFVNLYHFVQTPAVVNSSFLGLLDLAKPNLAFAILAGLVQFFQTKMLLPKIQKKGKGDDFAQIMQGQMVYFFPVITIIILLKLPSALGLYWIVSGIFTVAQQYIIIRKDTKTGQEIKK
jgi:YidC/Oxa1 family membrane protein insertase